MTSLDDMRWAYSHRIAYALGALDAEDEARYTRILGKHPGLAVLLAQDPEALDEDIESGGGSGVLEHIPDEVLARWPKALGRSSGTKRFLLEAHLLRCDECRGAVELLASLVSSPAVAIAGTSPAERVERDRRAETRRRQSRLGIATWGWIWGGAATAALLWVALVPQSHRNETLPVVTPRANRNAPEPLPVPMTQVAVLLNVPPALAGEASLVVLVITEGGNIVRRTAGSPRELDRAALVVDLSEGGWYRVRYQSSDDPNKGTDTWFTVERR